MIEKANSLKWKRKGRLYELQQQGEILVQLQYEAAKNCLFKIGNQPFEVQRKGFWNPTYHVLQNETAIASLNHQFWGSKGLIHFQNGAIYQVEYKYKNILTLCISDNDSEILRYFVKSENNKQEGILQLGITMEDAERLLLLVTIAMVVFLSIFNEFNTDDGDEIALDLIHLAS